MLIQVRGVVTLALLMVMAGCSVFQQRSEIARFNAAYSQGDYASALKAMPVKQAKNGPVNPDGQVFELLHRGEAYRLSGQFSESVTSYDLAEAGMKYLDTESVAASAGQGVMSVLVNDSERDYRALMAEAILVNTYKALDFLCLGEGNDARVEFNRADDRTRRAVDFFAKEIQAEKQQVQQEDSAKARAVSENLNSGGVRSALRQNYGDPSAWQVYSSFIVPSSTYLHGLYFLANGAGSSDYERALTSLSRVAEMAPSNPTLAADATLASDLASGKQSAATLPPQVWVMYENGLGPVLEEVRFGVPLIINRGRVQAPAYFGIALPRYADRQPVPGSLVVTTSTGERHETARIADMGRVVRTEMQERFPGIMTRAISSALVKAVAQGQAADNLGVAGQLATMIYAIATTQADTRSWQATPDHWSAVRLERPADGRLNLSNSAAGPLGSINLPAWPYTLVYIKRPTLAGPATVMIMDLQGNSPGQVEYLDGTAVPSQTTVTSKN